MIQEIYEQSIIVAVANTETLVTLFTPAEGEKRTINKVSCIDHTPAVRLRIYKNRECLMDMDNALPVSAIFWTDISIIFNAGEKCSIGFFNGTGGNVTTTVVVKETIETA